MINDVLYYTLPCIATLVFPEPEQWKKSWETVYRSLMPHRRSIIEDEQRVKSVSELPPSPLPHTWRPRPLDNSSCQRDRLGVRVSPESLPPQLIVLRAKKDTRQNHFGLTHVAGYLISAAPSRFRRFSGLTETTSTLPSRFCRMRSWSGLRNGWPNQPPTMNIQIGTMYGCHRWASTAGAAWILRTLR